MPDDCPAPARVIAWLRGCFGRRPEGFILPWELERAAANGPDPIDWSTWRDCPEVIAATGLRLELREIWRGYRAMAWVVDADGGASDTSSTAP